MRKIAYHFLCILFLFCSPARGIEQVEENALRSLKIENLYGSFVIDDPLLIELLESHAIKRLKQVHQYGVVRYVAPIEEYSRYDHSIGVMVLLRHFGMSLTEQAAGLLHDASHTAFSHVGDTVFDHGSLIHSYQDDIHEWYLLKSGISAILEKYGLSAAKVNPKYKKFPGLDQDLPNLCADRIEYNLQGGVLRGLLTHKEVTEILADLHYEDGRWFFKSPCLAKKFALVSLHMTEHVWGAAWDGMVYIWTADAIKQAIKSNLFSFDDFHFSTDDAIWHKLVTSTDPVIAEAIEKIRNYDDCFELCDPTQRDLLVKKKFRGIDPLVKVNHAYKKLTQLDSQFLHEFDRVKELMNTGWSIHVKEPFLVQQHSKIGH